jgi:hypothetical protein
MSNLILIRNHLKYIMASVKLQKIFLAGLISVISSASFADVEQVTLNSQHLQTLVVELASSDDDLSVTNTVVRATTWKITSNNAVTIDFSGASPEDNEIVEIPRFYKQEVDAKNNYITGQYDYLETLFGIKIDNIDSTATMNGNIWGGGSSALNTPELLTEKLNDLSPHGHWGSIMPSDQGDFILTLYSKGSVVDSAQSGRYTMNVTLIVSANEQLNP